MKKVLSLILVLALCLSMFAGCGSTEATEGEYVALITDVGTINDQSFNQSTWEGVVNYCTANGISYNYYQPTEDTDDSRYEKIEQAIAEGATVIVMPGYLFETVLATAQVEYPDVKFIALDVSVDNVGQVTDNTYMVVFQEEECGYLAGYAAVMEGETDLGFLGGMAVPAVIRYGIGYVQGAADAAEELGVTVNMWYGYGGQFYGDADITAAMDTWMAAGCDTIFACGGGIYTSVVEAISNNGGNGALIGVDTDQSLSVTDCYVMTSAFKGLTDVTEYALECYFTGNWDVIGGTAANLGLTSDETREYVGLPRDTWSMTEYTIEDYDATIAQIRAGQISIINDTATTVESLCTSDSINLIIYQAAIK